MFYVDFILWVLVYKLIMSLKYYSSLLFIIIVTIYKNYFVFIIIFHQLELKFEQIFLKKIFSYFNFIFYPTFLKQIQYSQCFNHDSMFKIILHPFIILYRFMTLVKELLEVSFPKLSILIILLTVFQLNILAYHQKHFIKHTNT